MRLALACLLLAACSAPPMTDAGADASASSDVARDEGVDASQDVALDVADAPRDTAAADVPGADAPAEASSCPGDAMRCAGGALGFCGDRCLPHVRACDGSRDAGSCVVACAAGFNDCNRMPFDGCEIDLMNDPSNCSACGVACTRPGATCIAGICN